VADQAILMNGAADAVSVAVGRERAGGGGEKWVEGGARRGEAPSLQSGADIWMSAVVQAYVCVCGGGGICSKQWPGLTLYRIVVQWGLLQHAAASCRAATG
jgi:hypothetical protein